MFQSYYFSFFCFLVVFPLGLYFFRKVDKSERYLASFICGLLAVLFTFIVLAIGNRVLPKKWSKSFQSVKLVNMKDQNSLYGSFFLGSGQISGVHYYTYYYEYDGGFKRASLNPNSLIGSMSDVIIFEEDRKDGELRIFKLEYTEEWHKFFGSELESKRYEFHIPKGSITRGFELR